jgi:hypothetical protein
MRHTALNKFNIFLGDVFLLNYYGILVFFQVCGTTEKNAYLVELATEKIEYGIIINPLLKTSKNPYFVLKNNVRSKSTYRVMTTLFHGDAVLAIKITDKDRIYQEALSIVDYPKEGYFYAYRVRNYLDCCWQSEEVEEDYVSA